MFERPNVYVEPAERRVATGPLLSSSSIWRGSRCAATALEDGNSAGAVWLTFLILRAAVKQSVQQRTMRRKIKTTANSVHAEPSSEVLRRHLRGDWEAIRM